MSSHSHSSVLNARDTLGRGSLTVTSGPCWGNRCVLYLDGSLRAPADEALRNKIASLLARGERSVVLDLSKVHDIDAAGVSELVRAHNMVAAANGVLQIAHATGWVRKMLERAALFGLLAGR